MFSAERVETFRQTSLPTSIDGHSAQGKTGGSRLPQLFGECEKILRLVGFKRDNEFLFAETEGVRQMNFDILELSADHKILFDQRVALFVGNVIPIAGFCARIEKMIFFRARDDVETVFEIVVLRPGNKHSLFRDRQIIVGGFEKTSEIRAEKSGGHLLNRVQRIADAPEHQIGF